MIRMKAAYTIFLLLSLTGLIYSSPLDDKLEKVRKDLLSVKEAQVADILKTAQKEVRYAEAIAVLKPWLQNNPIADPNTMYLAGHSAELAGDYETAASFYRRILSLTPPPKALADKVTPAFYRLMIVGLRDPNAAFVYMRKHGEALRNYGNAKQFDSWFLKQAIARKDITAAAERLALIHNSGDAGNHQTAMNAFMTQVESFNYKSSEILDALKAMAKSNVPNTVKLRLNWIVEILPLNAKVDELFNARKEVPASVFADAARAAEALLAAQPYEGSILVLRGWCNYSDGHTPNYEQKTGYHRNLTNPPLLEALNSLSSDQIRTVIGTRGPRERSVVSVFDAKEMAKFVISKPEAFNSITTPGVPLYFKGMTQKEAKALAPHLARNPSWDAALIRAIAAGSTTADDAIKYIASNELWRFNKDEVSGGRRRPLLDFIARSGLKRSSNEKGTRTLLSSAHDRDTAEFDKLAKGTESAKIRELQSKVIKDLLSEKPSIPDALGIFDRVANAGSVDDKVNFLKTISAAKMSGDQEYLLRRASGTVYLSNKNRYAKVLSFPRLDVNNNFVRFGRKDVLDAGNPLGTHFQGLLQKQMAGGSLNETLIGMWLRCVDPKDKQALAFMKKLVASPAWKTVDPAYLRLAQNNNYFGDALGVTGDSSPKSLSAEILALPAKPNAQQVKAALTAVVARLKTAPDFPGIHGLSKVSSQPKASAPFAEDIFIHYALLNHTWEDKRYQPLMSTMISSARKSKDYKSLLPLYGTFWHMIQAYSDFNSLSTFVAMTQEVADAGDVSTAASLARIGMRFNSADSRHHQEKNARAELKKLYAQLAEKMGVAEIPVRENEPGYSIFLSQKEYALENLDTAWALYDKHHAELEPVLEKLRQDYCFWLLSQNVERSNVERVEELVKLFTIWDRRGNANFDPKQQAELKLAYADVAFQKRAYGTARSWYRKVADSREYKGTQQQYRALLGSIAVDREEKNYSAALTELEKLMLVDDSELRIKVRYATAQIYYAQERFVDALKEVNSVLRSNPKHSDAVILQGEIWVRMRRLEIAEDLEVFDSSLPKEVIIPGEFIKIDLKDPTLSLAGTGASIEAEVRAASGDVERVMLRPLGDGKSKYRAEIKTELGAPKKGDKVLQVLGRDMISYGYSQRFRQKMKDLPDDPDEKIAIASDFRLDASAGAFPPREGERRLTIEELGLSTADQALGFGRIRPGNPVYVRVFDPDQSKTGGVDEITIEVKSTSGDIIRSLALKETGPYTGEFEGEIPTTQGQAVAFAYSAEPGRDPNMAISSADYPGWSGQPSDKSPLRYFTIDLNDNVKLNEMTITAPDAQALTAYIIQTSLNGQTWENRGGWPQKAVVPWDGRPQFATVVNGGRDPSEYISVPGLKSNNLPKEWVDAIDNGLARNKVHSAAGIAKNLKGLSIPDMPNDVPQLVRFRAYFYQPEVGIRTFRVEGFRRMEGYTAFLIDGKPSDGDDPFTIEREFKPGLHEIQVWNQDHGKYYKGMKMQLLSDSDGGELSPCPDSMFDPKTFPKAIQDGLPGQTVISQTGETTTIRFGQNISAQLVRILIGGNNGPAPAISKITLSDTGGKQWLPVKEDYQTLRKNKVLEVLPGDTVFVKYVDTHPYSPKRKQAEKKLIVAFNDATMSASFLTYVQTGEGRQLKVEDIRRFKMDDNVGFIITDPDMDVSPERDTVKFMVKTSDGNAKEYTAYEIDKHGGRFLGKVFPITGAPQRDSEIKVEEGGTLTAIYRDMENLDPGIPTDRTVTVEHAKYKTPALGVYTAIASPKELPAPKVQTTDKNGGSSRVVTEVITPRVLVASQYLSQEELGQTQPVAIYNSSLRFDVVAPHLALAQSSKITAYVQTESGRKADKLLRQKAAAEGKKLPPPVTPFDVNVPGTLKLTGGVGKEAPRRSGSRSRGLNTGGMPDGYVSGPGGSGPKSAQSPIGEGRFKFSIPLILGDIPVRSYATKAAEDLPSSSIPSELAVRPGDKVHVGYAYLDQADKPQWYTTTYSLTGHVLFDVMNETYSEPCTERFVGQKVFVRVIAPDQDKKPTRDSVTVSLKSSTGYTASFSVQETFEHSAVFKGSFKLDYAKTTTGGPVDPNQFFMHGFPVRYGDTVTVSLDSALPSSHTFSVNMGADGKVEPFSKRYTDSAMAIKTNFTLAECFFELAKKHREMGKGDPSAKGQKLTSAARREIDQAKKLLREALATHRDPEQQAHAEYLLGNLDYEYADTAENDKLKLENYKNALVLFTKIPQDYPEEIFAPKAQYKKAMVYEKMGHIDAAVDEYVKLAYKYPDDELIPKAMSRIGGQFEKRGLIFYKEAKDKMESTNEAVKDEGVETMEQANMNFIKAANIFVKLYERYPDHELAGLSAVRAGENFIRLKAYGKAIEHLQTVYENEKFDGNTVLAPAMFWSGWANELIGSQEGINYKAPGAGLREAYNLYNRTRYEHSTTVWAKKARGRLSSKKFDKIRIEDEKRRERIIEAMEKR